LYLFIWVLLFDDRSYLPKKSLAWETVIAAFGMISQVGPAALERPERASFARLLPTMMFHAQTGRNAHCLS
jgi:hypothetical protein